MTNRYGQAAIFIDGKVAWVPVCGDCGAVVLRMDQHDEWHDEMDLISQSVM